MLDKHFAGLSPAQKAFVRACQDLNFGWIDGLLVHRGEPMFGPKTRMRISLKLDAEQTSRPELALDDFALPAELLRFLVKLHQIGDGIIDEIEVRGGLPRKVIYTKPR